MSTFWNFIFVNFEIVASESIDLFVKELMLNMSRTPSIIRTSYSGILVVINYRASPDKMYTKYLGPREEQSEPSGVYFTVFPFEYAIGKQKLSFQG